MDQTLPPDAAISAEAHFDRGNGLRAAGRNLEAVADYDRALSLKPDYPEALNNRANALRDLGRFAEALDSVDRAIAVRPDYGRAHTNRGNVLRDLGRFDDALASQERALQLRPGNAIALLNHGNALRDLERFEEALASYNGALRLDPRFAAALNNRSLVLHQLKRDEDALVACERALALSPASAEAHFNRANVLFALERIDEAVAEFDLTLRFDPKHSSAWANRGSAFQALRKPQLALDCFERAHALNPGSAEILLNLGSALGMLDRHEEALARYREVIEQDRDNADAMTAIVGVLEELSRHDEAIAAAENLAALPSVEKTAIGLLAATKRNACDWRNFEEDKTALVEAARAGTRLMAHFGFLDVTDSAADQFAAATARIEDAPPPKREALSKNVRYRHDKIRIAYLSADFHDHPTSYLAAGLFEAHDSTRFETTAISWAPEGQSSIRSRLHRAFDRFLDARMAGEEEIAKKVRAMEIDIAVDLMGFTRAARPGIFALRPAPVQACYLGYPGTTGDKFIDYLIADSIVVPEGDRQFYTEAIAALPDTYQCTDAKRRIGETPSRAECGLPETGFVFCSFNQNRKITPPVFDIWMRLLQAVNGSVLWLFEGNAAAVRNLKHEAEARGVDAERIVFAPRAESAAHLARHRLADLYLDTFPYNGHTTASDSLWAGVPIVTCTGNAFAARVATSLAHAIGVPEMAATSFDEYERLALKLAREPDALAALKRKIAANRSTYPLFDTKRFCRHLEDAFTAMHERYERGEAPASFAVPARP